MTNPFQTRETNIIGNSLIRTPQQEAYAALAAFARDADADEREVGIVLPVGCGKSGCITITPFAFKARRALVVAPGLNIAQQLHKDFDPSRSDMFYAKCAVLTGQPYPEPVEIRRTTSNLGDLLEADVVITNIQQLQGDGNRWLTKLPDDFFDLILFDEGHHAVANSWISLKAKFPNARIINFSATPLRADGQLMAGRVSHFHWHGGLRDTGKPEWRVSEWKPDCFYPDWNGSAAAESKPCACGPHLTQRFGKTVLPAVSCPRCFLAVRTRWS